MAAIEELRRAVLGASDARQAHQAYEQLFRSATRADVETLESDPDAGIALQAAWSLRRFYAPEADHRLNREFVRRFLALFETRMAAPPPWWKNSLLAAIVYDAQRTSFPGGSAPATHRVAAGPLAPAGLEADPLPGGGVRLRLASHAAAVAAQPWSDALERARRSGGADRLAAVIQDADCFFAVYPAASCEYLVCRVDAAAGHAAWRAESWAAGCPAVGGQTTHDVELTADAHAAFAFGAAPHALYAEAFDRPSGRVRARFCTSLWSE
jgi:hypothetical protein